MAAQITAEDVKSLLTELGYSIPDVLLTPILSAVSKIDACLDGAGYDEGTQTLIKLYAAALMSASSGARRIKSQGAPSGASRSFDYDDEGLANLRTALSLADTSGCTESLPISAGQSAGFFMVLGG
ncbi:MAG: hypothetical protein QM578_09315 [Pantoea sp.]|uniref:DUF7370 family protein n=1 Tax=Pantoea sp. TaxID=69393 RepID=UPI0039E5FB66